MDLEKRIQKDWNLIKDFNILEDIEDLRKLYQEKPYGKCLRKYTAYPWSKENFFFGDNAELNEYYKTTTDIPFYLHYKIGQKFHSLTLLEFYRDENNIVMVKCRCDCGNEVARKWESVNDGNSRTCGCWHGQGRKTVPVSQKTKSCPTKNVLSVYPELVKDEWDYKKNEFSPENISIHSNKLIWWKPKYGKPFQSTIQERVKSVSGTSFPAQAIYYFVKRIFPDAINRAKYSIEGEKTIELDVYVPSIQVGIEFDGFAYHNETADSDEEKNLLLSKTGMYFIRVREERLRDLDYNYGEVIHCSSKRNDFAWWGSSLSLHEVISKVIQFIKQHVDNMKLDIPKDIYEKLLNCHVSYNELAENTAKIYGQYIVGYQKENIAKTCLIKYWDFEKNGTLLPQNVSIYSDIDIVLTCPKGHSIYIQPAQYEIDIIRRKKSTCEKCFLHICPAIPWIERCIHYKECELALVASKKIFC